MNKRKKECLDAIKKDPNKIYQYLDFTNDLSIMKKVVERNPELYSVISPELSSDISLACIAMKDMNNYLRLNDSLRNETEVIKELFKNLDKTDKDDAWRALILLEMNFGLAVFYSLFTYCSFEQIKQAIYNNSLFDIKKFFNEENKENENYEFVIREILFNNPFVLDLFKYDENDFDKYIILDLFAQKPTLIERVDKTWINFDLFNFNNINVIAQINSEAMKYVFENDYIKLNRDDYINLTTNNPAIYVWLPEELKEDKILEEIHNKYYKNIE